MALSTPTGVALVTCAELPDLDPDDHLLRDALIERGVAVEPVAWDHATADWSGYGLAVLRSPWDYPPRIGEFIAWSRRVPRLANPADVIAWNTDKTYLRDLAAAGIPVVHTNWVRPGETWSPPAPEPRPAAAPALAPALGAGERRESADPAPGASEHRKPSGQALGAGEYVVKPTISAGSRDTGRYDLADARQRALAVAHVARLGAAGRTAMVQPYLSAVDTAGETAVLCLPEPDGRLGVSHAIRKGPMLDGPDPGVTGLFRDEDIAARTPTAAEVALAHRVLAAIPGGPDRLLYARVDLIPGPDGAPVLLELELTEPSLFLRHGENAATRLATAIIARL